MANVFVDWKQTSRAAQEAAEHRDRPELMDVMVQVEDGSWKRVGDINLADAKWLRALWQREADERLDAAGY